MRVEGEEVITYRFTLCLICSSVMAFICSPSLLIPFQVVASDGVRAMMESALTARDRVGVQDFVLLENYTSEAAFIENLRKRFKENLIYVSESINKALSVDCSGPIPLGGGPVLDGDFVWNLFSRTLFSWFWDICVFSPSRRTSALCWCQ